MEILNSVGVEFVPMEFTQAMQHVRDDEFERTYVFYIESLEIYYRMQQAFYEKVSCFIPGVLKTNSASYWAFPVLINLSGENFDSGYMNACNIEELNRSLLWYDSHRDVASYIIPVLNTFQACGLAELF